jgi:antitoxin component YwqK of YwqJK toxin-antitoxin module
MTTKATALRALALMICLGILTGCATTPPVEVTLPNEKLVCPDGSPLKIQLRDIRCKAQDREKDELSAGVLLRESGGHIQSGKSLLTLTIQWGLGLSGTSHTLSYVIDYTVSDQWGDALLRRRLSVPELAPRASWYNVIYDVPRLVINDLFSQTREINRIAAVVSERRAKMLEATANGRTSGVVEGTYTDPSTQVKTHYVYRGQLRNGQPHGKGKMVIYTDPDKYLIGEIAGEFSGFQRNGHASIHKPFYGSTFNGFYIDGKLEGPASSVNADGSREYYNYHNDELHGAYKKVEPDGATLNSSYQNGKPDGTATLARNGKVVEIAEFQDGELMGEWVYHNGSFVEKQVLDQYQKEAANSPLDNIIGTALKLQGMKDIINHVTPKSGGGRKFIGKGSPPVNSFDANGKANARYRKWAYGE